MTSWNQGKKVPILRAIGGKNTPGIIEFMDIDNPISQAGNKKYLWEPQKLIERIAEKAGVEGVPLAVLETISTVSPTKGWVDLSLSEFRSKYKTSEKLHERGLDTFHKTLFDYMRNMHFKEGMYNFSGRADGDKLFFVKYHPKADGSYLKELPSDMKGGFEASFKDYKAMFGTAGPNPIMSGMWKQSGSPKRGIEHIKDMFRKSYESNMLYDLEMNGFEINSAKDFKKALDIVRNPNNDFITTSKALNKRSQIWFTNGFAGDRVFLGKALGLDGGVKIKYTKDIKSAVDRKSVV